MAKKAIPRWAEPLPVLSKAEQKVEEYEVFCAECGSKMKLRFSHKYDRHFYGCVRFPDCLGAHGAHPDGKPLGIPASKETRSARIRAHAAFDKLWQGADARMNRNQAYA